MTFFLVLNTLIYSPAPNAKIIGEWRGEKIIEVDFLMKGSFNVPFVCTFSSNGEFDLRTELDDHQAIFEIFKSYYGLANHKYTLVNEKDSDDYLLKLTSDIGTEKKEVRAKLIFRSNNEIDIYLKEEMDEKHRLRLTRQ